MGQKVLLVLREQARQSVPKNPDRLICPDRQGQGCRNGQTVFLQRRHKLPEHSTPPEDLQCRTLCTCRAQATVPECRRNAAAPKRAPCRACARPRSALLFRLERIGKRFPIWSTLSDQAFRIFQSVKLFACLALLNLFGRTF